MLEAPVDGDPAGPPGFEAQLFGARGVAREIENVEILAGENVPVAIEKGAAQMLGERGKGLLICLVVGVDRIVSQARADERVVARDRPTTP
jgi:hypothetical protein